MKSQKTRYRSEQLFELVERLHRVYNTDEMTKDDCDEILVGAIALNLKYIKSISDIDGRPFSNRKARELVLSRVNETLDALLK
jgi:hypothetical protein